MNNFFQANLDGVFFICGLAFLAMGLAIVVQQRQGSFFRIGGVLWLLGVFGIIHGFGEFLDILAVIRKDQGLLIWLDVLHWFISGVSYYFFFEFGRQLLVLSLKNKKYASFFRPWLGIILAALALLLGSWHKNFLFISSVYARYLLGFPAGFLVSSALIVYYCNELKGSMPGLRKNFYYPAVFLLFYGILDGLVVPPVTFPPGSIINTESFLKFSGGIPVEAFRALCAVFAAIFIGKMLLMFKWEVAKNLSMVDTERFIDKVTSSVEEMIMVIDKNFRIKWANAKLKIVYGKDVLDNFCYKIIHRVDSPCRAPSDVCPINEVIRTNKPVTVIHKHSNKAGNAVYAEVSAYPMFDDKGRPTGDYVHTSRDVTQRIKAEREQEEAYTELKAMQEKLLSTEKMASLGKLSAGIAHEINNPIGFVLSNLSTLESYLSSLLFLLERYSGIDTALSRESHEEALRIYRTIEETKKKIDFKYLVSDLPKLVKETLDGAQRVVKIVKDLKSFARKDEIAFVEADINELIDSALNIVWNEVKYKADVVKDYGQIPMVPCHSQQITQALMNIIINGAQAIEKNGRITIKTFVREDKVFIEISDTGCGINEEILQRLFEPFFTTKKIGEGTGLGLAIVYGIIQNHKGKIEVKSKLGEGSTFIISLPIMAAKVSGKN